MVKKAKNEKEIIDLIPIARPNLEEAKRKREQLTKEEKKRLDSLMEEIFPELKDLED